MATKKRADPSRRALPMFVLAVLIGLGALVPFALQAYRDIRISKYYKQTTCQVISSSSYTTTTKYQNRTTSSTHPELTYQLKVDGRWYTATGFDNMKGRTSSLEDAGNFIPGRTYDCWYDPLNPESAVLVKRVFKPFYLGLVIPLAFLSIGGNMLVRSLRPVPKVTFDNLGPGEALAVKLRPELTGVRAAGCLVAAAIVFTAGAVAAFVYISVLTPALFIAAIDAFIIYHLIRTIRGFGIPEPVVEIDRHPLHPGDEARIFVRQKGPARFDAFKVSLVCEEQGEKGTRKLHTDQLLNRKDLQVSMAGDLAESLNIVIPKDARPSTKELQRIITWKIVVKRKGNSTQGDRDFVFGVTREHEIE